MQCFKFAKAWDLMTSLPITSISRLPFGVPRATAEARPGAKAAPPAEAPVGATEQPEQAAPKAVERIDANLRSAVEEISRGALPADAHLQFALTEENDGFIISIVDTETGEIIREIDTPKLNRFVGPAAPRRSLLLSVFA